MGPDSPRARRGLRAGAVSLAVLVASLALARYGDDPLAAVVSVLGFGGAPGGTAAALAGIVAPLVFTALALRSDGERGLRALLGGLALVGASVGAGWLTGSLWTAADVPGAILLTYAIGLAGVVIGYLLAATDTDGGADTYDTPSYVRDDPDPITTLDGGSDEPDSITTLDDGSDEPDSITTLDDGSDDEELQFFLDDEDE